MRVISIETIADKFPKFPSRLGFLAARVNLEQARTKDGRNKKNERERMKRWCEEKGFPSIFRFENSIVLPLSLSLFETKDLRDGVASPPFAGWNKP